MAAETTAATGADAGSAVWESRLDSVVVHAVGAVCRRRAAGTVADGGRVRVGGLPRALRPESLRARVVGGPGRVAEARLEAEVRTHRPADLPELRTRVERLAEERDAVFERRTRLHARIEEVAALQPLPPEPRRGEPHRRTPADAWLELADFVDGRLTVLHGRLAELDEELRLAEHVLDVARDELARSSTAAPSRPLETAAVAALTVVGAEAADSRVELEIEYVVPGAVWVPTYRLSHREGEAEGRLVLRASVAQLTGEDWSGVRLALSTADLARPTGLPRLRSVRIGRRQAAPAPSGWREQPPGLADLFDGYDTARHSGAERGAGAGRPPLPPPFVGGPPPAPQPFGGGGLLDEPDLPASSLDRAEAPRRRKAGPEAMGYGGAAPAMPAAPGAAPGPVGAPPAMAAPRPAAKPRAAVRGFAPPAAPMPQASLSQASLPLAPPPPTGPPQPDSGQLDYAALVLAGPQESAASRGRLLPGAPADPLGEQARRLAEGPLALPLPGHAVRPREAAGSFDYRYDAAAPADIPSDGTWHTVTVAELSVGLRTEYVCVPAVEEAVYATLVLANAGGHALLAGPVEVSVDGEFLLTAALPTLAPGASRRVGLGQAEGIRVARSTELRESTAGMLNNTTVLDHRVRVELVNRLPHPATVEVRERVPVTSDPDVRIEERPGWSPWSEPDHPAEDNPPSARVRRVELPAGGTAVLDGGYEIRIPAGKALVGGNRRS